MTPITRNPLKRYPIVCFFILAYAIAWIPLAYQMATGDVPISIAGFSPAISALVIVGANQGSAGLRQLIARLFLWRVRLRWYLVALLAPIALEILAILAQRSVGMPAVDVDLGLWLATLPSQLPALTLVLVFFVILSAGEELGWRGYALPGLESKYGTLGAGVILGIFWGLWHLPMFWVAGSWQYGLPVAGYVIACIGYTVMLACIVNGSNGSVLLASLYHGMSNLVLMYGNALAPTVIGNLYLSLPAFALVAIAVVLVSGPQVFIAANTRRPATIP